MTIQINQVFFIFNTRELSVNRKELQASTLLEQTMENPALEPLVLHLDNQLYMSPDHSLKIWGKFKFWHSGNRSFRCSSFVART